MLAGQTLWYADAASRHDVLPQMKSNVDLFLFQYRPSVLYVYHVTSVFSPLTKFALPLYKYRLYWPRVSEVWTFKDIKVPNGVRPQVLGQGASIVLALVLNYG